MTINGWWSVHHQQLGSTLQYEVFKTEQIKLKMKDWERRAKTKHRQKDHIHEPIVLKEKEKEKEKEKDIKHQHHLGIIGLNKGFDEHGHVINIPLPHTNGNQPHHHAHHQTQPHGHPPHTHAHQGNL